MKILLIWPSYGETKILIRKLREAGHEIPYWVCATEHVGTELGIVTHDHFEAWDGKPAKEIDSSAFLPPSKTLLERLYRTESIVMTMMNKRYDAECVDERKTIYYEMVRYWDGIFSIYKPEAVLFPTVPHTVYNYIIYSLAKLYGIKTIMFEDSWVSDRTLLYLDYEFGNRKIKESLGRNKGKKFSLNDLSKDLRDYYVWQNDKKADRTPIYMRKQRKELNASQYFGLPIAGMKNSLKNKTFFRMLRFYFRKQFGRNLKKEYIRCEKPVDWNKNFVYMAMSFQPERTSSPQSDVFVNQILAIETLASSLPPGWEVYVKEHPSQWMLRTGIAYSSARWPGYYERLSKIKNVRLVPIDTDIYALIDKSKAVSLIAGSSGWEAIIMGRPVLSFGLPWYRDFPGCFGVEDVSSCKKAIRLVQDGFKVDGEMVLNYLKCFDESSEHAYVEDLVDEQTELTREQSFVRLSEIIIEELMKKQN